MSESCPPVVAQVIGSFGGGGAQRLALNLAQGIGALGVRSVAVALRDAGGFAADLASGVELRVAGGERGGVVAGGRAVAALRTILKETGAGVVHVHGSSCLIAAAAAIRVMSPRPRLVFTWHDSGSVVSKRWQKRVPTLWALRRCDAVYGSSRDVSRRLNEAMGNGSATVFENGVPESERAAAFDDQTPRIAWAGRLVPEKDPEAMLRAMAALRGQGSDAACVLAGGALPRHAAYEASVRALHAELGLKDVAEMPGWIDDLPGLIGTVNIGVQTSRTEGLSMVLLEMMMAGLAIVATDVGDSAVAIEDGRSGLIVPAGDDGALQGALSRVAGDATLRRSLGAEARRRALDHYSIRAMSERALRAYGLAGVAP